MLVDHANRYPEAIPLRTVTAPAVSRALLGIFTRVGFPKEVVLGMHSMSAYLIAMWDEYGVTWGGGAFRGARWPREYRAPSIVSTAH